jgi:hypothetical protein
LPLTKVAPAPSTGTDAAWAPYRLVSTSRTSTVRNVVPAGAWLLVAAGHYRSALLAAVLGISLHEAAVGRPAVPAR